MGVATTTVMALVEEEEPVGICVAAETASPSELVPLLAAVDTCVAAVTPTAAVLVDDAAALLIREAAVTSAPAVLVELAPPSTTVTGCGALASGRGRPGTMRSRSRRFVRLL